MMSPFSYSKVSPKGLSAAWANKDIAIGSTVTCREYKPQESLGLVVIVVVVFLSPGRLSGVHAM